MTPNQFKQEVAKTVLHRRKVLKVNQDNLAELVGITRRYLYEIEKAKANPSLETLINIFDVLGLKLDIRIKQPGE